MVSVELRDLRLFAFHGLYEGEEKVGNQYLVNLIVSYDEGFTQFDSIRTTINYEELYEIVKQRMQIASALLEKLCESIVGKIKHQYPFVTEVSLSIYKIQSPIEGMEGKVGVTMHKKYDD
jgi:7,8-dihydroneopterin aldolase/epimerase/oxygenase